MKCVLDERWAAVQQRVVPASSLSPPQACHGCGNGNKANSKDRIVPVTQHSFGSCISKQLYLTEPTAKWAQGSAENMTARGKHCKPAHQLPLFAGMMSSVPVLCWCLHCHVFRPTRCRLVVIWNFSNTSLLDLLVVFSRQLWTIGTCPEIFLS